MSESLSARFKGLKDRWVYPDRIATLPWWDNRRFAGQGHVSKSDHVNHKNGGNTKWLPEMERA